LEAEIIPIVEIKIQNKQYIVLSSRNPMELITEASVRLFENKEKKNEINEKINPKTDNTIKVMERIMITLLYRLPSLIICITSSKLISKPSFS
jgi:hypothetical protein